MRRLDNIKDKPQSSIRPQANLRPVNFCVPGILSKCGAGTTWSGHSYCIFANKSQYSDKCMHYIEAIDGHCDCVDAQKDADPIIED